MIFPYATTTMRSGCKRSEQRPCVVILERGRLVDRQLKSCAFRLTGEACRW